MQRRQVLLHPEHLFIMRRGDIRLNGRLKASKLYFRALTQPYYECEITCGFESQCQLIFLTLNKKQILFYFQVGISIFFSSMAFLQP